jgi:hypothetical protein
MKDGLEALTKLIKVVMSYRTDKKNKEKPVKPKRRAKPKRK